MSFVRKKIGKLPDLGWHLVVLLPPYTPCTGSRCKPSCTPESHHDRSKHLIAVIVVYLTFVCYAHKEYCHTFHILVLVCGHREYVYVVHISTIFPPGP